MSRLALVTIFALSMCFATTKGDAQQKRVVYGPVVSAYLTGLAEELNELEYQLKHREISRPDYERAKQRLTILRRFVQRLATEIREDLVPELQILADDELVNLGLNTKPNPDQLQTGDVLENQWKLLSIELGRMRFFVFEKLPAESVDVAAKPVKKIDPNEVIETIIVPDNPPLPLPSQSQQNPTTGIGPEPQREVTRTPEPPPRLQPPRLIHLFLPQYTDKARSKGVEGELVVRALFQSDGKIKNVKVEKSLGHGLDQRAIESVKQIAFLPAQFDSKDIDANVQITFNFKLGKITFYLKTLEESAKLQGVKQ